MVYNDGDADLQPFLSPLLGGLPGGGGAIASLETESLRRALSDGTLTVSGVKLWHALHSDTWRHREAACEAYHQFLTAPGGLPAKYKDDTKGLFLATAEIAMIACRDKLL